MRNVLVISSVPEVPPQVHEELGTDVDRVHVVAPAVEQSRLQWLTNAEDDARAEAERTAARVAQATGDEAQRVQAEAGDSDPLLAVEDALRTFDADEIVVVVRKGDDASWLEEGAGDTIANRFPQLPVKTIEVERATVPSSSDQYSTTRGGERGGSCDDYS